MLERVESESLWLFCPEFADVLIRREAFECLEPSGEIIGCDEIGEMGLMSEAAEPVLPGVVKWVSLSVSTV